MPVGRTERLHTRRDFLGRLGGAFAVPLLAREDPLSGDFAISEDLGDLERELIADALQYVNLKYDVRDVQVDFINGRGLGKAVYGVAYTRLGRIPEGSGIDAEEKEKASRARGDFIETFGPDLFLRYQGRNVVALKDTETLQEQYPPGTFVVCSRLIRRASPELWYKLLAVHELGHILFSQASSADRKETLDQLRSANEFLELDRSSPAVFLAWSLTRKHPGHVDCYSFNRFLRLGNSRLSAAEEFVQILGFHTLNLPMSRGDEVLRKKLFVVRTFMEKQYGRNRSIFSLSDH